MSDIMFMRGYGFPKGSTMDYAGYAGSKTWLPGRVQMNTRASAPDASIFQKIPALDGLDESFGTEYVFTSRRMPGYGDMVLPTLNTETGEWEPTPPPTGNAGKIAGAIAVGLGLWFLFGR